MRVPMDFNWPLNHRWVGYLNPYSSPPECQTCSGRGFSAHYRQLQDRWYSGWNHNLSQDEVDVLVDKDCLREFTRKLDSEGRSVKIDPAPTVLAADVNAKSKTSPMTHDSINCYYVCKHRCEADDQPYLCETCSGHGDLRDYYDSSRYQDWGGEGASEQPYDPPTGEGWQLWETTSEGSPMTPVFESAEALARWCADNKASVFGGSTFSYEQWLEFFLKETGEPLMVRTGDVVFI